MKLAIVLFVVAVACMQGIPAQSSHSPEFYCGRRLSETLAYWCPVIYEEKRSGNSIGRPFKGWFTRQVRDVEVQKRGIVDECCYQPCTLDVLLSYC